MGLSNKFPPLELWPEDVLFAMFCLCMEEMQRRWPEAYQEAASSLPPAGPKLKELAQVMDSAIFAAIPTKGNS